MRSQLIFRDGLYEIIQSMLSVATNDTMGQINLLIAKLQIITQATDIFCSQISLRAEEVTEIFKYSPIANDYFVLERGQVRSCDIQVGEAIWIIYDGREHMLLRTHNKLVSLTDPNYTWNINAIFYGEKVPTGEVLIPIK